MAKATIPTNVREATAEFEIDELERKTARLAHQWIARIVWELEDLGTGDLPEAAARAEQASQVLSVLDQMLDGAERVREAGG